MVKIAQQQTLTTQSSTWKNVTREVPCRTCGHDDWCSYTDDAWICRRQGGGGSVARIDRHGCEFHLYGSPSRSSQAHTEQDEGGTPCATADERHAAYTALLKDLPLEAVHALVPDAHALGYRTCPKGPAAQRTAGKRIYKALTERSELGLLRIPGAIVVDDPIGETTARRPSIVEYTGCYIPVTDTQGRIVAIRIRLDDPEGGGRYRWLRGDKSGSTPGLTCHVSIKARQLRVARGLEVTDSATVVRVTEGEKKADVATMLTDVLTISVPSSGAWKRAWDAIQDLGTKTVRFAYDSDARANRHVCGALVAAVQHYLAVSRTVELEVWDPVLGKGLDDVLLTHGADVLRVVSGQDMYRTLVEWCDASGCPVPETLRSRVVLYRCLADLAISPEGVSTPEVLRALVVLSGAVDMDPVIEAIQDVGRAKGQRTAFERALGTERAKVKSEKKAAATAERREKAERAGQPVFSSGSYAEIAQTLIGGLGKLAVYDEGSVHRYDEKKWSEVAPAQLSRTVQGYDGAPCGHATLKINNVKTPIAMAQDLLDKQGFFREAANGFAFDNGFVRVDREGIHLDDHAPSQRVRTVYDYPYDPNAECPGFRVFLREIFSRNLGYPIDVEEMEKAKIEAEERANFVLEFVGLSLLGLAPTLATKALILLGDGANGKSTLTEVLRAVFPDDLVSGIGPHEWANDQKVARLAGKRLNIVSELPSKDLQEAEIFKGVVSGDLELTAKNVYERPFGFYATAGHLFCANALPASGDGSHGFARRNAVIPMYRVFLDNEQDRDLKGKLIEERAGIMRLLLESAQRAVARGRIRDVPESSRAALAEWQAKSDPVRTWLLANATLTVEPDQLDDSNPATQLATLFADYSVWARNDNRRGITQVTFSDRVRSIVRDLARQDLALLARTGDRAAYSFVGDGDEMDELERAHLRTRLENLIRNDGVLRVKVEGSSVRRLPLVATKRAEELEIARMVGRA